MPCAGVVPLSTFPAMQCMLFDSLVMPILSYATVRCRPLIPEQAQALKSYTILKQLLRVRNSTANDIALAEFGRYPLQICFWQQILRHHDRAVRLPDSRLVKLALVDVAHLRDGHVVDQQKQGWRASVSALLSEQPSLSAVFSNTWMQQQS